MALEMSRDSSVIITGKRKGKYGCQWSEFISLKKIWFCLVCEVVVVVVVVCTDSQYSNYWTKQNIHFYFNVDIQAKLFSGEKY